jgi:two-component system chemotaxis response regulator CheV
MGEIMGTIGSNILLETGTNEVEILELFIDEGGYTGYYGVNVAKVLEIITMPTEVMRPPHLRGSFVAGIFNHRGKLVVLLDLAVWLGKARAEDVPPKVLITEFNGIVTAFLVSGVTRIHRATWSDIRPLDGYAEDLSNSVTGVITLGERLVFLLDLEKAISDVDPRLAISLSRTTANTVGADHKPIQVLHADDSLVIRKTLKSRLEENHIFAVESVANGDEAWSYLYEIKKKCGTGEPLSTYIDIILTDIEMPGMDGYHLCKLVKDDPELKAIPVVLFSSLITEKLLHKGTAVGADGQFSKPDMTLMQFMQEAVEKTRAADQAC